MDKMHLLAAIDPGVLSSEITHFLLFSRFSSHRDILKEEETIIEVVIEHLNGQ
jgi:hypothetical protein